MSEPKLLPVGIQDFKKLRSENCVYIDKTALIYQLITTGHAYFLSRPRRFGKSLLISTLDYLFRGQREFFHGLWIDHSDYHWPVFPVIRIDMSRLNGESLLTVKASLKRILLQIAEEYGVTLNTDYEPSDMLDDLIVLLSKQCGPVVVLVDEYDKPILDHLQHEVLSQQMRDLLKGFYSVLKAQDENLRFVILTGVTRFSKVSVFSGLNNLIDLSMDTNYSTLLGYTEEEMTVNFSTWIQGLAEKNNLSFKKTLDKIGSWYDGYLFAPEGERVYNPFSTLMLFKHNFFRGHWFATGTPTFLMNLIRQEKITALELETLLVKEESLTTSYDAKKIDVIGMLYQTGYLTIKEFFPDRVTYALGYPNVEVEQAIDESLLSVYTQMDSRLQVTTIAELIDALKNKNYEELFRILKNYFSSIPYDLHLPFEKYYQTIVYLIFTLVGIELQVEVHTNRGRIDAVLEFEDHILIFEFKLDKTLEAAFYQMQDKNYPEKYLSKKKKITLFSLNFSVDQRNIESWASQELL